MQQELVNSGVVVINSTLFVNSTYSELADRTTASTVIVVARNSSIWHSCIAENSTIDIGIPSTSQVDISQVKTS
jgi:hypothetical protein